MPLIFEYPAWLSQLVDWDKPLRTVEDRMRLAIDIARMNVDRGSGGPFGALIVETESGRLVSAGMNAVVRSNNCTLHAEMVAFMMAGQQLGSYTLAADGMPAHDLITSCEPCAMCLGATLWSGVRRVVCGAAREDAHEVQFDEGPVFDESYRYLEARGITIRRHVLREEAAEVLRSYRARGGPVYNA